jgi:hypothetical protein
VSIVGVHGIGQQQLGRRQLLQSWLPALADGMEMAFGGPILDPPFDLAFYGNVFLPSSPSRSETKGPTGPEAHDAFAELSHVEVDELLDAAGQALTPQEIAAAEADAPTKGLARTPKPLQAVLRALDRKFGAPAGVLYLGTLRQVRRYLADRAVKSAVDGIVDRAVPGACRVLVGHSLGSVVAAEFLRRHPEHTIELFLTVGSPLGLRMVQSRLPVPFYGADQPAGIPAGTTAWVNVRDPRDPVTCAGPLGRRWPGIVDRVVDNGRKEPHSVWRYLSKIESGAAILECAPGLAVPRRQVVE